MRLVSWTAPLALCLLACPGDDGEFSGETEGYDTSTGAATAPDLPNMPVETNPGCDGTFDPFDPNELPGDATVIMPDSVQAASLAAGCDEVDWWEFSLPEPSYMGIEAHFISDSHDLSVELWDAGAGTLIQASSGGTDIQAIHELLPPGTYRVAVTRVAGDPVYSLETYALSTASQALPSGMATRVFCPRFNLNGRYEDASNAALAADSREDYGLTLAQTPPPEADQWVPHGLLVRVTNDKGEALLGWGPLVETGCTAPVKSPSVNDTQFILEFALWSHFVRDGLADAFVIHYNCENPSRCSLPIRAHAWETDSGVAVTEAKFIATGGPDDPFRQQALIHWVAAFAEFRVPTGLGGAVYTRSLGAADYGPAGSPQFQMCSGYCPNGMVCQTADQQLAFHCRPKTRTNRRLGGHPTADIAADTAQGAGAPERKFTIAHELGHAQTVRSADGKFLTPSLITKGVSLDWCSVVNGGSSTHTKTSVEWQSGAFTEGIADFYATVVFNDIEPGAWLLGEDVENDTNRFTAFCPINLSVHMTDGKCGMPGDATSCADLGAANSFDWTGTLWDFAKIVGDAGVPGILSLLPDVLQDPKWDPGSTTMTAYNRILTAAAARFPMNGVDFDAAAQNNGTKR